jgi:hypothetical protein
VGGFLFWAGAASGMARSRRKASLLIGRTSRGDRCGKYTDQITSRVEGIQHRKSGNFCSV